MLQPGANGKSIVILFVVVINCGISRVSTNRTLQESLEASRRADTKMIVIYIHLKRFVFLLF